MVIDNERLYCATREREREMTIDYRDKGVAYLKRFTFGGTILNKEYRVCPEKSKVLFFEPGTPEVLYIKYKAAPRQKVSQQTANPGELGIKSAKAKGNQVSIKEVHSIRTKPPKNWDAKAATTELRFL